MGCCVSTNNGDSTSHKNLQLGSESLKSNSIFESRAPPPSAEEETVKEVLSETPELKKQPQIKKEDNQKNGGENFKIEPPLFDDLTKKPNGYKKDLIFNEDEVISEQEVSEICSLSLSETVSTTTLNDDESEVKQRVKRWPAAKISMANRAGPRDRVVGKSPTRRTDQSPDKRSNAGSGSVRLVQSKESGTYQAGRRGLGPGQNRKDPGEGSGRRSRSPATNRSIIASSPSARRTNGSPGRVRTGLPDRGGGMEGKWPSKAEATTNESLENPLVSLECFIFL